MKQLFVDTSGWDALADKADKYHDNEGFWHYRGFCI